jgi:hypothetical protein
MIRTSEGLDALSEAFAKAQAKFGAAIKASQNPAFRSKYADLPAVIDATLEHLNSEGIAVMQHPSLEYKGEGDSREAYITVTTRLQHKTGQWMESDLSIPAIQRDRFDAQSCGSAITYACRYALRSICTVPQADDDANAASGVGTHEAAQDVARQKLKEATKSKDPKIAAMAEEGLAKLENKAVPAIFYVWHNPSQTAEVIKSDIVREHWKTFKAFWNGGTESVVLKAQELEDMKFYFEKKGILFKQVEAAA